MIRAAPSPAFLSLTRNVALAMQPAPTRVERTVKAPTDIVIVSEAMARRLQQPREIV